MSGAHRPCSPRIPTQPNRFGAPPPVAHNFSAKAHRHRAATIATSVPLDARHEFSIPTTATAAADATASTSCSPPTAAELRERAKRITAEDVAASHRNMTYFFQLMVEGVEREKEGLGKFSAACETTLASTRAACSELPSPNRLEVAIASMLLSHLSFVVSPAYGELMRRLLDTLFTAIFEPPSDASSTGGGWRPDPAVPKPHATYEMFIKSKLYLESNDALRDSTARLQMRLEQLQTTVRRGAAQMTAVTGRAAAATLKTCFNAWRTLIRARPRQSNAWLGVVGNARNRALKEMYFLRWSVFWQRARGAKHVQLAAVNHRRLVQRIGQLQQRCTTREDELARQRVAKERAMAKAEQLETLMATDRTEAARAKAKLTGALAENNSLLQLSNAMLRTLERTANPLLGAMVPSAVESAANGNARHRAMREQLRMGTLLSTDAFLIPVSAKVGGAAFKHAHLDDVKAFLAAWVSATLSAIREHAEELAISPDRDLPDVVEHVAAVRAAPISIADFGRSLADGRVLQLLLWRAAAEERSDTSGGTGGVGSLRISRCDNDAERCALVVRMATYFGVDGGVTAPLIMRGVASERQLTHLVARIFGFYATCVNGTLRPTGVGTGASSSPGGGRGSSAASQLSADAVNATFMHFLEATGRTERWRHLARCVENFVAIDAASDTTDGAAAEAARELLAPVTLAALRDILPPAASRFAIGDADASAATPQQAPATDADADEAHEFFVTEVRAAIAAQAMALRSGAEYYACFCAGEGAALPAGGAIDATAWARFIADTKLVSGRIVSKNSAEMVFRMLCSQSQFQLGNSMLHPTPASAAAGATLSSPLLGATATTATASSMNTLTADAAAAATTNSSMSPGTMVTIAGLAGAGDSMFVARNLMGLAVLSLFLGKLEPPPPPPSAAASTSTSHHHHIVQAQLAWSDVDEGVAKFKMFLREHIVANIGASLLDINVITPFNTVPVQDVLRQLRDPLRKLFAEYAKEKGRDAVMRMRLMEFAQLFVRELKIIDATEAAMLYHAVKNYATLAAGGGAGAATTSMPTVTPDTSPSGKRPTPSLAATTTLSATSNAMNMTTMSLNAPSSATTTTAPGSRVGIDFNGFVIAIVALSRAKVGFPLVPTSSAVHQFLTAVVFPSYAFKLKLKW